MVELLFRDAAVTRIQAGWVSRALRRASRETPDVTMTRVTSKRWVDLMRLLGAADSVAMFDRVREAYSESHRSYHTIAHLEACLDQFDWARSNARSQPEVEAALWLHDVIYLPRAGDNESRSARFAGTFLRSAGAPPASTIHVETHILSTAHTVQPTDTDSQLVVDIDLSILGQSADTYDQFERSIRKEYAWVPWPLYRRKRLEILRSFARRASIYATDVFRERLERAARVNLERAISRLKDDSGRWPAS